MGSKSRGKSPKNERPRGKHRASGAEAGSSYWLYGRHAVTAALQNPNRRIKRVLLTPEAAKALADTAASLGGMQYESVLRDQLDEILDDAVHQGAAVLVDPLDQPDLEQIVDALPEGPACLVMLDQVTDPQNAGAIMRSAAAFGAIAVVATDRHAAAESAGLAKASAGTLETLPYIRITNLARTMDYLRDAGFWFVGLDGASDQDLKSVDLTGRIALVMGAEGQGLRRLTAEGCDHLARIPISGAESLNVSAAAAVALYEMARQRG